MAEYREQVKHLREWTVLDIQNRPAHTIRMMQTAATTIEKLMAEIERLNKENFWLTGGNDG